MQVIGNKKRFLEYIAKQIEDDEVVILTTDKSGHCKISGKKENKSTDIQFSFAQDAFADEGIGHIIFGETTAVGLMICKQKDVSELAMKIAFPTPTK